MSPLQVLVTIRNFILLHHVFIFNIMCFIFTVSCFIFTLPSFIRLLEGPLYYSVFIGLPRLRRLYLYILRVVLSVYNYILY